MNVLMVTDLEGCAGVFHRELQISDAAPHEYARTLRMCTREVVAAIEGAWAAGASNILIEALHDIDLDMLPAGVEVVRGMSPWDIRYLDQECWDALVLVGLHGGAHLTDCALAHTFLPSWQIETSSGVSEGWAKQVAPHLASGTSGEFSTVERVWLNGRLVGETSLIMTIAAAFGVPTACVCGCIHACDEAAELVPQVEKVPVKWGINFRAARMLSPRGAQQAIREGVERALQRLSDVTLVTAASEPQEVAVRYVHPERAARSARWPGARRIDECTVAAAVRTGRAIPELRFLFARPRDAEEGPTVDEAHQPASMG
jgi:D-amino peptidase